MDGVWFASREAPDRYGLLVGLELSNASEVCDATTLARPTTRRLLQHFDQCRYNGDKRGQRNEHPGHDPRGNDTDSVVCKLPASHFLNHVGEAREVVSVLVHDLGDTLDERL